jgi:hypothetical protein
LINWQSTQVQVLDSITASLLYSKNQATSFEIPFRACMTCSRSSPTFTPQRRHEALTPG